MRHLRNCSLKTIVKALPLLAAFSAHGRSCDAVVPYVAAGPYTASVIHIENDIGAPARGEIRVLSSAGNPWRILPGYEAATPILVPPSGLTITVGNDTQSLFGEGWAYIVLTEFLHKGKWKILSGNRVIPGSVTTTDVRNGREQSASNRFIPIQNEAIDSIEDPMTSPLFAAHTSLRLVNPTREDHSISLCGCSDAFSCLRVRPSDLKCSSILIRPLSAGIFDPKRIDSEIEEKKYVRVIAPAGLAMQMVLLSNTDSTIVFQP